MGPAFHTIRVTLVVWCPQPQKGTGSAEDWIQPMASPKAQGMGVGGGAAGFTLRVVPGPGHGVLRKSQVHSGIFFRSILQPELKTGSLDQLNSEGNCQQMLFSL
jgi:hypothetical protein